MEYGWICPRCGVVNAPHMDMCKNCLPTKEEQEEFAKQQTKAKACYTDEQKALIDAIKSLDWIWGNRIDSEIDKQKDSRNELLLYYKDLILYWDKFRFTVERRNGDVLNDVTWNEISSWWIAPTLSNDVITIVVKGKSGFLYSFDLDNHSEKSKLFIQDVLRNYCKDKESYK